MKKKNSHYAVVRSVSDKWREIAHDCKKFEAVRSRKHYAARLAGGSGNPIDDSGSRCRTSFLRGRYGKKENLDSRTNK